MSKYALTKGELEWLGKRIDRCGRCKNYSPNLKFCRCIDNFKTDEYSLVPDYRDAAEFEARVAKELAQLQYDVHTCPGDYGISEPHMALFWARIAVEQEMDNDRS